MGEAMRKAAFEHRDLTQLKPFPLQERCFPELSPEMEAEFAKKIRTDGMLESIHILPENSAGIPADTILFGHRRVRALIANGVMQRRVLVRYDLADAPRDRIVRLFAGNNTDRRQLSKIDEAQVIVGLFEDEQRRPVQRLSQRHVIELKQRIALSLRMSVKNAGRYLTILAGPPAIRQAFRDDQIGLAAATRAASLPRAVVQAIEHDIDLGCQPKDAVAKHAANGDRAPRHRGTAVSRFVHRIQQANLAVENHDLKQFKGILGSDDVNALETARRNISGLLAGQKRLHAE